MPAARESSASAGRQTSSRVVSNPIGVASDAGRSESADDDALADESAGLAGWGGRAGGWPVPPADIGGIGRESAVRVPG